MRKILLYTFFLCIVLSEFIFAFNRTNSWNSNDFNYDSLYSVSLNLINEDKIVEAIKNLNYVISNSRHKDLVLNSYYDLGQIYLSRSSDYSKALEYFLVILNTNFSYKTQSDSVMRNFPELKEKTLFMIGYIYHNHIGNLTQAQKYYTLFLNKYSNSSLLSSVDYELTIINKAIENFNNQNNN